MLLAETAFEQRGNYVSLPLWNPNHHAVKSRKLTPSLHVVMADRELFRDVERDVSADAEG